MKKKRLTLAIPCFNQLNEAKSALGLFKYNTSDETEFLIIDNGSTEDIEGFFLKHVKPKRLRVIRNEENLGMVRTLQQIYENCETEVLAITHNDVFVYEPQWDIRILHYFETIDKLGMAGFFGAQGCGPIGERIQDIPLGYPPNTMAGMSQLLEAELHGFRLEEKYHATGIFDGLMLIFNMDMLREGKGFDQRYKFHHYYDKSASLQSLALGYKNIVVNVPCHHLCGMTANRAEYQTWIDKKVGSSNFTGDKFTHDYNMKIFNAIWGDVLPVYVENDFSFRSGSRDIWDFKGNKIVGYDWTKVKIEL